MSLKDVSKTLKLSLHALGPYDSTIILPHEIDYFLVPPQEEPVPPLPEQGVEQSEVQGPHWYRMEQEATERTSYVAMMAGGLATRQSPFEGVESFYLQMQVHPPLCSNDSASRSECRFFSRRIVLVCMPHRTFFLLPSINLFLYYFYCFIFLN